MNVGVGYRLHLPYLYNNTKRNRKYVNNSLCVVVTLLLRFCDIFFPQSDMFMYV